MKSVVFSCDQINFPSTITSTVSFSFYYCFQTLSPSSSASLLNFLPLFSPFLLYILRDSIHPFKQIRSSLVYIYIQREKSSISRKILPNHFTFIFASYTLIHFMIQSESSLPPPFLTLYFLSLSYIHFSLFLFSSLEALFDIPNPFSSFHHHETLLLLLLYIYESSNVEYSEKSGGN